jgi:hypothetical protein
MWITEVGNTLSFTIGLKASIESSLKKGSSDAGYGD